MSNLTKFNLGGIVYIAWTKHGWFRKSAQQGEILPAGVFTNKDYLKQELHDWSITDYNILEINLNNISHPDLIRIYNLDSKLFTDREKQDMLKMKVRQLFQLEIFNKKLVNGRLL